jgi:ribosome biogenesis SPOUT family RNA methylase Rps3
MAVFYKINPPILELIQRLVKEGREVIILSANPSGSEMIIKEWLRKIGLPSIRLILKDKSRTPVHIWKWDILRALGNNTVLVDDSLRTVQYINRRGGRAFYYRPGRCLPKF